MPRPLTSLGLLLTLILVLGLSSAAAEQRAAGTSGTPLASGFTYQGRLVAGGLAASGSYALTFRLFDAEVDGTLLAEQTQPVTLLAVCGVALLGMLVLARRLRRQEAL